MPLTVSGLFHSSICYWDGFICSSCSNNVINGLGIDDLRDEEGHIGQEVEDERRVENANRLVHKPGRIVSAFTIILIEFTSVVLNLHWV